MQLQGTVALITGAKRIGAVVAESLAARGVRVALSYARSEAEARAAAAGVEEYIEFDVCDFESTEVPEGGGGVIYFNPEYGERLGEATELEETYARMGDFLKKKCKGYTGYVFTGNMELAKKIGLKASRRMEFYNSQIDCRLLEYELYSGTRKKDKDSDQEDIKQP